jgi:hypothetical protein
MLASPKQRGHLPPPRKRKRLGRSPPHPGARRLDGALS